MYTLLGDLFKPGPDMCIGGGDVQWQTCALERSRQWRHEAFLQVAIEALDLALSLGSIRAADLRAKTVLLRECRQPGGANNDLPRHRHPALG